ncbi:DNA mismatch repair protein MutS [Mucilaginibacter sp. PAMB04274]|uniref:MutS-related protein n=1 Tax=Mucilaginibacter sp. PAMB04274 TaxID=3138568 RepID=UPI0031F6003E
MSTNVLSVYTQNISLSEQQIKYYQQRVNLFSVLRLVAFGCLLALVYWSVKIGSLGMFAIGAVAIGAVFNWLVGQQNQFDKQRNYYESFKAVNQNEIESVNAHTNIYDNGQAYADDKHFYTADLDIFGQASLYQLTNRAATVPGKNLLARWLKAPASKPDILSRQEAIEDIASKTGWKLKMQAMLLFNNKQETDELDRLFSYLNKPVIIPGEAWLRYYVKVAPWIMIVAIVASFYYAPVKHLATFLGLLNFAITGLTSKATQQTDLIAGRIGNTLKSYADIFKSIEEEQWAAKLSIALAQEIKPANGRSTALVVAKLSAHINSLNARLNLVVGFVLNVVLVWNVRYVIAIEDWKRNNHENVEAAFGAIAGFEALLSVAGLRINHPEWCMPQIAEGADYTLTAKAIAHPLIKGTVAVANDYTLVNTRTVDIITGSNMAGKSTFLRTLGINTVLALAGAPACAQAMQVSVVQLFSYMRIKDSLNESTSTFKAELDRLQMLLQAVEEQPNIFFLIDEMLRGTNSVDKYLGSKAVIERLVSRREVGLVATHDLQLAELEKQYSDYIRNFYFDIQVQDGEMLFDYKLKPGECKTFNASLLLERIGIKTQAE